MTDPIPLRLRPYRPENAEAVLYWRNQPRVLANMTNDRPISPADHAQFLAGLEGDASREYFLLERGQQVLAGLSLVDIGQATEHWGCFLCSDGVMPGLFPALLVLAADRAFDQHGADTLASQVVECNLAPQRLNRYLGIAATETQTIQRPVAGETRLLEYRLNRSDWPPTRVRACKLLTSALQKNLEQIPLADHP